MGDPDPKTPKKHAEITEVVLLLGRVQSISRRPCILVKPLSHFNGQKNRWKLETTLFYLIHFNS